MVTAHMRTVYNVPGHQGYMRSGYPSELVLVEAAARLLNFHNLDKTRSRPPNIAVNGPLILSDVYQKGFLARGERNRCSAPDDHFP